MSQAKMCPIQGEYRLVSLDTIEKLMTVALRGVIYLEDAATITEELIQAGVLVRSDTSGIQPDDYTSASRELHDVLKAITEELA